MVLAGAKIQYQQQCFPPIDKGFASKLKMAPVEEETDTDDESFELGELRNKQRVCGCPVECRNKLKCFVVLECCVSGSE